MQNKTRIPSSIKKESSDEVKNPRPKYSGNNVDSTRNSNSSSSYYKKNNEVNISNNNLQKIKLIENIYNEELNRNNKAGNNI
jgi:hypothetical protein